MESDNISSSQNAGNGASDQKDAEKPNESKGDNAKTSENNSKNNSTLCVDDKDSTDKNVVANADSVTDTTEDTMKTSKVSPRNSDPTEESIEKLQLLTSTDDENEDDVPGDFFDDFLKEDFMAGLDIVDDDEWDEEKHGKQPAKSPSGSSQKKKKVERKRIVTKKGRRKEKRDDAKNVKSADRKSRKSRDREERQRKSKEKKINANEFDIQRDPNKTRRDIERDKARCEKDKEKKIISEKLQLVETGLVPPGMEMETDIEVIKKQKELEPRDNSSVRSQSRKSPSPRHISITPKKRSITPKKRSPHHKSPRRSPGKRSPRRSPIKRSPRKSSPKRSPRRSPKKSPRRNIRRLSRSPRRLSRSPRRKSRTPVRLVRMGTIRPSPRRSPDRRRSRDRSLRRSLERSRRTRSRSPTYRRRRRTRSRTRSPKRRREEKKSFLQEIAEKLNETRPVNVPFQPNLPNLHTGEIYHIHPQALHVAASPTSLPSPVPPPPVTTQYPPQRQQYDHYDRNFFIGAPPPQTNIPKLFNLNVQLPPAHIPSQVPIQQVPSHSQVLIPQQVSTPQQSAPINTNFNHQAPHHPQDEVKTQEDLNKLFQDKKITLTEFLAITAKPEVYSASPALMKEKVKVISRCQEAIKYLGNSEKKFSGPLIIHKSQKPKPSQDKFKSPLMKSSQMKFSFTEIPNTGDQKYEFSTYVNNLLENLGLMHDVIVIDDAEPDVTTNTSSAPPAPVITNNKKTAQPVVSRQPARQGHNQLAKLVQTEPLRCVSCEKRNKIVYKTTGVQCGGDSMMFSIGIQVKEDDFYAKIPKNQSLASLTPAQLLARSGSSGSSRSIIEVDDFDLLFPAKSNRPVGYPYPSETPYGANRHTPLQYAPPRGLNFEATGGARGARPEGSNRYGSGNYF